MSRSPLNILNDMPFQAVAFLCVLFLNAFFQFIVLRDFGFVFTDTDQSIMWLGLKDYANCDFHEPRMYGQAYNTMLESFLAVPLFKLGFIPQKALAITTSWMAFFPFLLLSMLSYRRKRFLAAIVILSIPLLLPIRYAMLTSLPRGFVSGIFVASFGLIALYYERSRMALAVFGFCSVLGFSVNPNSVILTLPVLVFLFLRGYDRGVFYASVGLGALLATIIHLGVAYWYLKHPYYALHGFDLYYSPSLILPRFQDMDMYFNDVTPVFWKTGFLSLVVFVIGAMYAAWKREFSLAVFLAVIPVLVLLTFGLNKVHDASDSIFFSYSRMYLALPVLFAVWASFLPDRLSRNIILLMLVPFAFTLQKITLFRSTVDTELKRVHHIPVRVERMKTIETECANLARLCDEYSIDLIIVSNHYSYDFLTYGCPALHSDLPNTLRPVYERRTWRLIEDAEKVYGRILVIDDNRKLDLEFPFVSQLPGHGYFYLIEDNDVATITLLDLMEMEVRAFR